MRSDSLDNTFAWLMWLKYTTDMRIDSLIHSRNCLLQQQYGANNRGAGQWAERECLLRPGFSR